MAIEKKHRTTGRVTGIWTSRRGARYDAVRVLGKQSGVGGNFNIVKVTGGYSWDRRAPRVCVAEGIFPIERRLYAEIFVTPHTYKELVEIIYRHGDNDGDSTLAVHLAHLNSKIAKLGQRIVAFDRRDGSKLYRIELGDRPCGS